MDNTRRTFLTQAAASLGLYYLAGLTPEILAQAHEHAKAAPRNLEAQPFRFFTPQQAADYDAFASQIIPTDETPGAKEANVVRFVDFALSEIEPQNKQDFAKALDALNAQAKKTAPEAASFAALTSAQQVEAMKAIEKIRRLRHLEVLRPRRILRRSRRRRQQRRNRLEADRLRRQVLLRAALRLLRRAGHEGESMSAAPPQAKYKLTDNVDFLIVGCGASGSVLARELSRNGFSVVALEQGPWLDRSQFTHDEYRVQAQSLLTNNTQKQPMTFRKTPQDKAVKQPALIYGRMVGGGTVHFTANYWRFHEIDFIEASKKGTIAGTGFADWPITYADMEPYYTKAEWDLGVSGQAGASPFDPPRSKPYPLPPMPVKSSGVLFEQGARKLGYHPFPAPMAILSQSYQGRLRLRALRLLHGLRLRDGRQVEPAAQHGSAGRRHRTLRDPSPQLRAQDRARRQGPRHRRRLLRPERQGKPAARQGGHRLQQRRRNRRACC